MYPQIQEAEREVSAYSEAVARLQGEEASAPEDALPESVFQAEMQKLRDEERRERCVVLWWGIRGRSAGESSGSPQIVLRSIALSQRTGCQAGGAAGEGTTGDASLPRHISGAGCP